MPCSNPFNVAARALAFCLLSCYLMFTSIAYAKAVVVDFAVLSHSTEQEVALRQLIDQFEVENPLVKVRLRKLDAINYPDLYQKFTLIADEVDVFQWYAGKRLEKLADANVLSPVTQFWQDEMLMKSFPEATHEQVTFNNEVYGIPLSIYTWKIFYKKSLFKRLGLSIPNDWASFVLLLETLKQHGITPIGLGSNPPWQVAGWFDYLMLRTNGPEFYRAMVNEQLPFTSLEVQAVFEQWKQLLDAGYFFTEHAKYQGSDLMPLLYRNVIGLNLTGTISMSNLKAFQEEEIGFFTFPTMRLPNERSILAPMSVLAKTKKGHSNKFSEKLLSFFARAKSQEVLNNAMSTVSPLYEVNHVSNQKVKQYADTLAGSTTVFQFLDRELEYEMAEFTKAALAAFIEHRNITKVTQALEQKRKERQQNKEAEKTPAAH